ncbi:MAG: CatB-related O-acetyltransferase [Lachnospiraceae bacterium]|nr:CatB-related O-acetyltransferase [Lachnospiraceae bacterium]
MEVKLKGFREHRENVRRSQEQYTGGCITAGDFSYGVPYVMKWDEKSRLEIGKFCSIAMGVTIVLGGEHRVDWITTYPFNAVLPFFPEITGHPASKGDIIIGNDVWIGSGAKILSGVKIGDGAVIAANALVTSDVAPYSIAGGVPAKHIRYRFPEEQIEKLCEIRWWDWPDEAILVAIPLLQSERIDELWELYLGLKEDGVVGGD